MKKKLKLLFLLMMFLFGVGWQAKAFRVEPVGTSYFPTGFDGTCLPTSFPGEIVPVDVTVTMPVDQGSADALYIGFTGNLALGGVMQATHHTDPLFARGVTGTVWSVQNAGEIVLTNGIITGGDGVFDGAGYYELTFTVELDVKGYGFVTEGEWDLGVVLLLKNYKDGVLGGDLPVNPIVLANPLIIYFQPEPFTLTKPNSFCSGSNTCLVIAAHGGAAGDVTPGFQPGVVYSWAVTDPWGVLDPTPSSPIEIVGVPTGVPATDYLAGTALSGTNCYDLRHPSPSAEPSVANKAVDVSFSVSAYKIGNPACKIGDSLVTYTVNPEPMIHNFPDVPFKVCVGEPCIPLDIDIQTTGTTDLVFGDLMILDENGEDITEGYVLTNDPTSDRHRRPHHGRPHRSHRSNTPDDVDIPLFSGFVGDISPVNLDDADPKTGIVTTNLPVNTCDLPAGATITFTVTPKFINQDGTECPNDEGKVNITIKTIKVLNPDYLVIVKDVLPADTLSLFEDVVTVCPGDKVDARISIQELIDAGVNPEFIPEGFLLSSTDDSEDVGFGLPVGKDYTLAEMEIGTSFTAVQNLGVTPIINTVEIIPYIIDGNGDKCLGDTMTIIVQVNPIAQVVDLKADPETCPYNNNEYEPEYYTIEIITAGADSVSIYANDTSIPSPPQWGIVTPGRWVGILWIPPRWGWIPVGPTTVPATNPLGLEDNGAMIIFDKDVPEFDMGAGVTAVSTYDPVTHQWTTIITVPKQNLKPGESGSYTVCPIGLCPGECISFDVTVHPELNTPLFDLAEKVLRYKNGDMVNDIWVTPYHDPNTTVPQVRWERLASSDEVSGPTDRRDNGTNIIPRFWAVNETDSILRAVFKLVIEDTNGCKFYSKEDLIIEVEPYIIEDERLSIREIADINLCEGDVLGGNGLLFEALYRYAVDANLYDQGKDGYIWERNPEMDEVTFVWKLESGDDIFGLGLEGSLFSGAGSTTALFVGPNDPLAVGQAVYSVTPIWRNNMGNTVFFNVLVTEKPSITYLAANGKGTNADTFNPGNFVNIQAQGAPLYKWTGGASIGLADGSGVIVPNFAAVNATDVPVTVEIWVTPISVNGCEGTPQIISIIVNPTVEIDFTISNLEVCSEAAIAIPITAIAAGNNIHEYKLSFVSGTDLSLIINAAGNSITGSYTNSTNAPVSAIYSLVKVDTITGLTSKAITFTVTVSPKPTIDAIDNIIASDGTVIPAFIIKGNVTGGSFSWEKTGGTTIANLSTTGAGPVFPSFSAVNKTDNVIEATYTVYASSGSCDSVSTTFTIKVYPEAKIGQDIADVADCVDASFNLALTPPADVKYEFSLIGGQNVGISLTGNVISGTLVNASNAPVFGIYRLTAINSVTGVKGETAEFRVTVYPKPAVDAPKDIVTVSGVTVPAFFFTGNVSGGSYSWALKAASPEIKNLAKQGEGAMFPTFVAENLTGAAITATYVVTATSGNCVVATKEFNITVYPAPKVVDNLYDLSYCHGTAFTAISLTNQSTASVGYILNFVSGSNLVNLTLSGNSITGTIANTTNDIIFATYSVTPYNTVTGHQGTPKFFTVTVYPNPTLEDPADIKAVNGTSIGAFTFAPAGNVNVLGVSYRWEKTPTSGIIPNLAIKGTGPVFPGFTAVNLTNAAITATYTVYVKSGVCAEVSQTFDITVYPTPKINNIIPDVLACSDVEFTAVPVLTPRANASEAYKLAFVSGDNLGLTLDVIAGEMKKTVTATTRALSAIYAVVPYNTVTNDEGTAKQFTITVYPKPKVVKPANITTVHGTAIAGFAFTNVNKVDGVTYTWELQAGSPALPNLATKGEGSFPAFTAVNLTGAPITATYTVTATSGNGCSGDPETFTIKVYPEPKVLGEAPDQVKCNGETVTINLTAPTADVTYSLKLVSGDNLGLTLTGTTISGTVAATTRVMSAIYAIIPTNTVLNYEGPALQFAVTVYPNPAVVKPADITTVNGTSIPGFAFTNVNKVDGVTYTWELQLGSPALPNLAQKGTGLFPAFVAENLTGAPIEVIYVVTATSGNGCSGDPATFKITVYPTPKVMGELYDVAICDEDKTPLFDLSNVNVDEAYRLEYVSGQNLQLTLGTDGKITRGFSNTTAVAVTGVYKIVPYNKVTGHEGIAKTFAVTVQPNLTNVVIHLPDEVTYCSNDNVARFDFSSDKAIAGARFVWEWKSGDHIGSTTAGENFIPAFTAINNAKDRVWKANYTVKLVLGECESTPVPFSITVYPEVKLFPGFEAGQEAAELSVCAGDPVLLNVEDAYGVNIKYQWYRLVDGKRIPVGTNSPAYQTSAIGDYFVEVTGDGNCGAAQSKIFRVAVKVTVISQRWGGEVLVIDTDPATNGGYELFSNIQWYKDGNKIGTDAGLTWLDLQGQGTGVYHFTAKVNGGSAYESCPLVVTQTTGLSGISVYPNPVKGGETVTITNVPEGATVKLTSDAGITLDRIDNASDMVNLRMPVTPGVYVVSINNSTFTVIVK